MRVERPGMRLRLLPLAALLCRPRARRAGARRAHLHDVPQALCGGRVVAEPEQSTTFHQFDGPLESLGSDARGDRGDRAALPRGHDAWPRRPATRTHTSFGGRPLWVVRVTDEQAPRAGKAQVAVSLSVHGCEAAGREGGLRYLEDLARWGAGEPDHLLYAGDTGVPFAEVMRRTETWIAFTNSDGWAAGDLASDDARPGLPARQRQRRPGPQPRLRHRRLVRPHRRPRARRVRAGDRGPGPTLVERLPEPQDQHRHPRRADHAQRRLQRPHHPGRPVDARSGRTRSTSCRCNMIRTVERKFAEQGVVLDDVLRPAARRRHHAPQARQRRGVVRHRRLRRLRLHGRLVQPDAGLGPHGRRELPVATSRPTTPSSRSSSRRTSRPSAATSRRPSSRR